MFTYHAANKREVGRVLSLLVDLNVGNRVHPTHTPFDIQVEAVPINKQLSAFGDLLAACQWASRSCHHPACPIAKGTGMTAIDHDDCTCHVKAARAAIAKAEGTV